MCSGRTESICCSSPCSAASSARSSLLSLALSESRLSGVAEALLPSFAVLVVIAASLACFARPHLLVPTFLGGPGCAARMTKTETVDFVRNCVAHAMVRNESSVGMIRTLVVTADGLEEGVAQASKLPYGPFHVVHF